MQRCPSALRFVSGEGEKPTRLADIQRTALLTLKTVNNTRSSGLGNPVLIDKKVKQPDRTGNKVEVNVRKTAGV